MNLNRRGFFATITAVLAAAFMPKTASSEIPESQARVKSCIAHDWVGHQPCPVPDCPAGHTRDTYIVYTVTGHSSNAYYSDFTYGNRQVFRRVKAPMIDDRMFFWAWRNEASQNFYAGKPFFVGAKA